jgi:hypothetical protein
MKLYNGGTIIVGLIIFFFLATFPFFLQLGKANVKPEPKVDTPVIQEWEKTYGKKECIESKEFMRAEHMQLLNNWRDSVVRDTEATYRSDTSGKLFQMSLQNTCMHCHSNKKKFCDECHNYMAVKPFCWDCHIAPKEDKS